MAAAGALNVRSDGFDPLHGAEQTPDGVSRACPEISGTSADPQELQARLANKRDILCMMRDRGVMLADISPVPIYQSSGTKKVISKKTNCEYTSPKHKLKESVKNEIIRASFGAYAEPLIAKYRPKYVLVLGKVSGKVHYGATIA